LLLDLLDAPDFLELEDLLPFALGGFPVVN